MKHPKWISQLNHVAMFVAAVLLFGMNSVSAQSPCPPNPNQTTSNPTFPGCLPPGSGTFKILLVLDESGSIGSHANQVRQAVSGFADGLHNSVNGSGEIEFGIVEFASGASLKMGLRDVNPNSFMTAVQDYLNNQYSPNGQTNFVKAFEVAQTVSNVDMLFLITDGNPTTGGGTNAYRQRANEIKCSGTYIFAIGVTNNISELVLKQVSGPDKLNNPKTLEEGADWTKASFATLADDLLDLVESQFDKQDPVVNCPSTISRANDAGQCGANVGFTPTASDNCPNVNTTLVPASGSFFPVGETTVTFTATDNVGHSASCTFRVEVRDEEDPAIECPPNTTVSCEASLAPSDIGEPITLDNCIVQSVSHSDVTAPGRCPQEKTVTRTWTVEDEAGNINSCVYTIEVIDHTSPVITCPADITVECDTTTTATGVATATDNCDNTLDFSRSDAWVSGDCEWLCTVDRTWVVVDDCGNTSSCVQKVTKNTATLIATALPIDLGLTSSTINIPAGREDCVTGWLPYSGTTPKTLAFKNLVVRADCSIAPNDVDSNGKIVNPLLGEAIKMSILVKIDSDFGDRKVTSFGCNIPDMVKLNLSPDMDVNEFLRVTNTTLGNVTVQPFMEPWLDVIQCINQTTDVCTLKNN